jgi:hypothetical protein
MRQTGSLLVLVTAACATALAVVGAAGARSANGGANIGSAPAVQIGTQEFGNAADGVYQSDIAASYWKLSLVSADQVTIDWESSQNSYSDFAAHVLDVWPSNTTDFSINNADPVQNFGVGSNGKAESTFTASSTGVFPIMFRGDSFNDPSQAAGAYDFVVTVKHKLVAHLTQATASLLVKGRTAFPHKGTFAVQAFSADGKPVANGAVGTTLSANYGGAWHTIGKAVARGGLISVRYSLPAAAIGSIRLQADIGGGSYQGVGLHYRVKA